MKTNRNEQKQVLVLLYDLRDQAANCKNDIENRDNVVRGSDKLQSIIIHGNLCMTNL